MLPGKDHNDRKISSKDAKAQRFKTKRKHVYRLDQLSARFVICFNILCPNLCGFASLREIFSGFRAAIGFGVRGKKLLDLRSCRDTALAAGLSSFQAGSGGGKTDTLIEGRSLD